MKDDTSINATRNGLECLPNVLKSKLVGLCCNLLDGLVNFVLQLLGGAVLGHHAHDHIT